MSVRKNPLFHSICFRGEKLGQELIRKDGVYQVGVSHRPRQPSLRFQVFPTLDQVSNMLMSFRENDNLMPLKEPSDKTLVMPLNFLIIISWIVNKNEFTVDKLKID
jgi:hypothetical protein